MKEFLKYIISKPKVVIALVFILALMGYSTIGSLIEGVEYWWIGLFYMIPLIGVIYGTYKNYKGDWV